MKKVLAFGASNSKNSINKALARYATGFLKDVEVQFIDLNDYAAPIYSKDTEAEEGFPAEAQKLNALFDEVDGFLISLAENNGSYNAAFKSIYDWLSRIEVNVWRNKPLLLLSTSPGSLGGKFVMEAASKKFPRMGAELVDTLSIPTFPDNFKDGKLVNEELNAQLIAVVGKFNEAV